jgi:hypothetical protein
LAKDITDAAPEPIGYPKPSTKGTKQLEPDDNMVDTYYVDAKGGVPINYQRKPVGSCPYSKPMSRDLPLANVPMSMAIKGEAHLGFLAPPVHWSEKLK